ncbi:RecA-family ATPase [Bradyrhizobium diazoefficiens]
MMHIKPDELRPLIVTDPKIRKMLQLAGLRFMCSRARWLDSEATKLGIALKAGSMTSDEVDAKLEEMGALDLVYPLVTFDEMEADPPAKSWLIKGILARGETSAWIAPPGAMKSALLAEAAICVGAGLDWHGYRNKGAAGVLYFAIERSDLVKRRLRAHRARLV